jgi:hypothetical protein
VQPPVAAQQPQDPAVSPPPQTPHGIDYWLDRAKAYAKKAEKPKESACPMIVFVALS